MITEQELTTALQSFVGQEYHDWSTASDVYRAVRELLESDGVPPTNLYYDKDHQTVKVTYKRHNLLEVTISKSRSKKHYGWLGSSWCDWTVKSVNVLILSKDHNIATRMAEIDAYEIAKAEAADRQLQEAIQAMKALKALFPNKSEYDLQDLAKYIAKHRYTICDKIKEMQN